MEYLNLISVPAIAVAVYVVMEVLKKAVGETEKFKRLIPLFSLLLGAVFGVACFYFIPTIIPATNVVLAIVIGAASGLSATGTNQIIKQIEKAAENVKE